MGLATHFTYKNPFPYQAVVYASRKDHPINYFHNRNVAHSSLGIDVDAWSAQVSRFPSWSSFLLITWAFH